MTSPKTFKRYASQWLSYFYWFKEHPGMIQTVQCPDMKKAKAMRLEFYKAREAFLNDESMRKEFEGTLNSREIRITADFKVIFDLKDNNWLAKLLEESFEEGEANEDGEASK